ncbi:MAG TPA: flagellum-specific ATP synthase FliI, partial [Burkholderiaceae bacterium]
MTTAATERAARWRRYLADLEAHAAVPRPLVSEGMLVRVTGLVLEAAGVRAPVGSVCEVSAASGAPVTAEVV